MGSFQQREIEQLYEVISQYQKEKEDNMMTVTMQPKITELRDSNLALKNAYQAHMKAQEKMIALLREHVPPEHQHPPSPSQLQREGEVNSDNHNDNDIDNVNDDIVEDEKDDMFDPICFDPNSNHTPIYNVKSKKKKKSSSSSLSSSFHDNISPLSSPVDIIQSKKRNNWAQNLQTSMRNILSSKKNNNNKEDVLEGVPANIVDDTVYGASYSVASSSNDSLTSPITGCNERRKYVLSFGGGGSPSPKVNATTTTTSSRRNSSSNTVGIVANFGAPPLTSDSSEMVMV